MAVDAVREHDQHLASVLLQLYRLQEQTYRHCPQYRQMVDRYPVLRRSIAHCRAGEVVADPPAEQPLRRQATPLQWDRSHGEG
jgi:hypothetical protein